MPKIPIFKSHYSVGRSILTLELPSDCEEGGTASIFNIAQKHGLKEVFLLEDGISSFPQAFKNSKKLNISLRFGEIFYLSSNTEEGKTYCKVGIWALNDNGFSDLRLLHTKVYTEQDGEITFDQIKNLGQNLGLSIPFYDSFLAKNMFTFAKFTYDFASLKPTFFVEQNGLPEDVLLREAVVDFATKNECPIQETQTVLYENEEDCEAYMTYRIACNRSDDDGGNKKTSDMSNPNISGFGSNEFSWERFKRENKI